MILVTECNCLLGYFCFQEVLCAYFIIIKAFLEQILDGLYVSLINSLDFIYNGDEVLYEIPH